MTDLDASHTEIVLVLVLVLVLDFCGGFEDEDENEDEDEDDNKARLLLLGISTDSISSEHIPPVGEEFATGMCHRTKELDKDCKGICQTRTTRAPV